MILNIELSWRYLSLIQLWSSFMNSPFKKAVDPFFNVSLSHGVEMRQVIYPWVAWLSSEKKYRVSCQSCQGRDRHNGAKNLIISHPNFYKLLKSLFWDVDTNSTESRWKVASNWIFSVLNDINVLWKTNKTDYRKVASRSTSRLVTCLDL